MSARKSSLLTAILVALLFVGGCNEGAISGPNGDTTSNDVSIDTGSTPQAPTNPLITSTKTGLVEGIFAGNGTLAWLGIPYAKPPVGDLRWRAPRDPEAWDGVKKTDRFCSYCVQYDNFFSETGDYGNLFFDGKPKGSENCLYLNVWKPNTTEKKLPVYFFIHGGGNILGRSDLSIYDGANFAARNNMIFVTLNYRLGYFGWFSHPSLRTGNALDDSGNYGTLDIIKGLTWVKNNIESFGGDPNNVTIAGQSAGAMNVHSMMVSPLAKGLFHRAIMHSGFNQNATRSRADLKGSTTLFRLLKQDWLPGFWPLIKGDVWTRDYLRSKSVNDFYPAYNSGPTGVMLDGIITPEAIMGIYIDGTVIPRGFLDAYYTGNYNKVPVMIGCTMEEMKLFLPLVIMNEKDLYRAFLDFNPNAPNIDIKNYISPLLWPALALTEPVSAIGKLLFEGYGVDPMAFLLKRHQSDVFAYKFCWNDEPKPFGDLIGACHAIDLPFVFGNFIEDKHSITSFAWCNANKAGREDLSDVMMSYWGAFAKYGNPNTGNSGLPEWKTWSNNPGEAKRMIMDVDKLYMSGDFVEPGEVPGINDMLQDIMDIMLNPN